MNDDFKYSHNHQRWNGSTENTHTKIYIAHMVTDCDISSYEICLRLHINTVFKYFSLNDINGLAYITFFLWMVRYQKASFSSGCLYLFVSFTFHLSSHCFLKYITLICLSNVMVNKYCQIMAFVPCGSIELGDIVCYINFTTCKYRCDRLIWQKRPTA